LRSRSSHRIAAHSFANFAIRFAAPADRSRNVRLRSHQWRHARSPLDLRAQGGLDGTIERIADAPRLLRRLLALLEHVMITLLHQTRQPLVERAALRELPVEEHLALLDAEGAHVVRQLLVADCAERLAPGGDVSNEIVAAGDDVDSAGTL